MKLSEFIANYGDDDVKFQRLDDCATNISMTKGGSKASFVTPETFGFDGFDKMGLIVWLDRERVAKILADRKAALALQEQR
jgi:hypothetical protein